MKITSTQVGERILYIAYDDEKIATGLSRAYAIAAYGSLFLPNGFKTEFVGGMIDADDTWQVWHDDCPGLFGVGDTPQLALKDWEHRKTTTWWLGRFNLMVCNVRLALDCQANPEIIQEFAALIRDIRSGKFEYQEGGDTCSVS